MKISACIVSYKKDEEPLKRAIASIYDHVDEIIVIDTSAGDSLELTGEKVFVHPFTWKQNFSEARNLSFEKATGNILFWIDSDDTVINPENIRKLAEVIDSGDVDWIYSEYLYCKDEAGNIIARHWKYRLVRKNTGKWIGDVHEDLIPTTAVVQEKDINIDPSLRIFIDHNLTEEEARESAIRNLGIQLAEIERDGDKTDSRTYQYTGMSLQSLERYEEAIPYFIKHMQTSGSVHDKFWSAQRIAMSLVQLGRYDEALTPAIDSLKIFPQWNIAYFRLAEIYSYKEDWQKVIEWSLAGFAKSNPDTMDVISDLEMGFFPLARLAYAYLNTVQIDKAVEVANRLDRIAPNNKLVKEIVSMCKEAMETEDFVQSLITVVEKFRVTNRVKAAELLNNIPGNLDDDIRIQKLRGYIVPPKNWEEKEIAIYCGKTLEEWAFTSQFTGIGGSEEAVINISHLLAKAGYKVTIYNSCGSMRGEYHGVTYLPYYFFNPKDNFNILIGWRCPYLFAKDISAKKKYIWLHDIAYAQQFNEEIYKNVDKIFFLSKWHRNNLPECPEEKVFITNNGINPDHFKEPFEKVPNTAIYASSYDRGAVCLLRDIVPLILEKVPDFHLHLCYGLGNIEKEMDKVPHLRKVYQEITELIAKGEAEGWLTHHGRISHLALANLMKKTVVWAYPTEFSETNCITLSKVMAAGCWPVYTPVGALTERGLSGFVVDTQHIYSDKEKQEDFANKVVEAFSTGDYPDSDKSKELYSWESTSSLWAKDIL